MAIEKTIILNVDANGAVKSLDNVEDEIKSLDKSTEALKETTGSLTNSIDKMTGGLITGFKNAVGGVRKGIIAMKSLKIAIAATGVGLLVLAFGALVTFFSKSQKGIDKLSVVFKQFGSVIDVIIDRVIAVGEILSNVFSQPFSKTVDGVTDSLKGMGDEMEREIRLAKELELATQKLRDTEIDQIVTQALRRKQIAELRNDSKDQALTLQQRIDKLKDAQRLEQENLNEQLANQAVRVTIAARENARANSVAEDFKKLEEEKARLIDLQTESFRRQRTVISELESLKAQGRKAEEQETRTSVEQIETDFNNELEVITTGEENITDVLNENEQRRTANQKREAALRIENAELEAEAKAQAQLMLASQIGNALGQISNLFERGTAASKTAALAEVVIGTGIGFIQALDIAQKSAKGTGPAAAFAFPIFYASQIAAVLGAAGQAKNILSSVKGGGGGASIPSSDGVAPIAQTAPEFNVIGASDTNQLAQSISTQTQQPIKAIVVSREMTTQQALDREIESTATFG